MRRTRAGIALALILLGGLALRLFGLDWDQGHLFHPDERAILMKVADLRLPWPLNLPQLLDREASPLNPRWFPYGSFPLYLLKLTAHGASFFQPSLSGFAELRLVGRVLSALFDGGTILLVFLLGRRVFGGTVGLWGAALTALTVLHIQLSHFFAVDTILTFFVLLALLLAMRVAQGGGWGAMLCLGIAFGLALASKVSAAPLVFPILVAYGASLVGAGDRGSFSRWRRTLLGLLLTIFAAALTFFLTQPYALLDAPRFLASLQEQSEMVRRIRDYPYTRQYIGTPAYLYPIQQLSQWGMGWPLGLVGWVGLVFSTVVVLRRRRWAEGILLAWVWPYFLITGAFEVKFLRYLLPLTPLLILLGARLLIQLWGWARGRDQLLVILSGALIGIVLLATGFYALAYVNLYTQAHPAVRLSRWINEQVPPGALLLKEHWEEGLPDLGRYQQRDLLLYEPDTPEKLRLVARELSQADYLVFYSNRLYGTIPRLPERYPLGSAYYRLLFSGELGYELARVESAYPNLQGVSLVDDTLGRPGLPSPPLLRNQRPSLVVLQGGYADESFTVYDHPLALAWRNVRRFTAEELADRLGQALGLGGLSGGASREGLVYTPADAALQQGGGTWAALFDPQSWANRFPLLAWLFWVEVVSLAAFPWAFLLLRGLADRGYLLAKALGLLLLAYPPWLLASLRLFPASRLLLLATLGGLVLLALAVLWLLRRSLYAFVRSRWRFLLLEEGVFLGAFLAFYGLRLLNPDLWHPWRGGEKPMDFAYLNAVIKSTFYPPYDPWFAGGYLNYYYYGQLIVGSLIKLSAIVPAVAYNLAVPLLFALTVGGAYSLGFNLMAAQGVAQGMRMSAAVAVGLLAALFVAVLGNLDGLVQLVLGLWKVAQGSFPSAIPGLAAGWGLVVGLWRVLAQGEALPPFDYWRSSRMMPPTHNITEFPYFTFLFADLHAHLIALPFGVLLLGMVLNVILTPHSSGRTAWRLLGRALGTAGMLVAFGFALGASRIINSWDFPTYFVLALGALVLAQMMGRHRGSLTALGWILVQGVIIYGLSVLLYQPFHTSYELFYRGVQPSPEKTPLHQYLAIHGLFLFLVISFLLAEGHRRYRRLGWLRALGILGRYGGRLGRLLPLWGRFLRWPWATPASGLLGPGLVLLLALLIAILTSPLVAFLLLLLGLILLVAVPWLWRGEAEKAPQLFVLLAVGVAVVLGMAVEFMAVEGDIGRMNTVFKFYLQAWVLLGVAAAFALGQLLFRPGERPALRAAGRGLWLVALGVLLLGSFLYPLLATPVRLQDRFAPLPPTHDGMAFMRQAVYTEERGRLELRWDEEALRWMLLNLPGSPVILEGLTPLYRWGSRVSVYTGLPAVVGWDWHQKQQRWGYQEMVEERRRAVDQAYRTTNPEELWGLVRRYGVKYIYVGELERLYYPAGGIAKFAALVDKGLTVAYDNSKVRIYRVTATNPDR